jgi:hypothetical protein
MIPRKTPAAIFSAVAIGLLQRPEIPLKRHAY